jgi:glycosyltransferase involved in cell wall biosynthesis
VTQATLSAAELPLERHPLADPLRAELQTDRSLPGAWPTTVSVPVSILVPVKNEEANLPECLRRLRWAGQIVVVDSHSIDRTVPIAQAHGAEVHQFRYSASGWPKKKNWALDNVAWKHEWVLVVDADERMTPELAAEIDALVKRPTADAYFLKRRFHFMGRWIRHCGYYPVWNLRLFRHAQGRFERIGNLGDTDSGDNEIHEHVVIPSRSIGFLKHDLIHYAYPDLATWVEKHNRYSNWEAHAMLAGYEGGVKPALLGDPVARRRWLKVRSRWLPFRPLWRFLYAYIFQGGFLDGVAGYYLCWMLAWYEFLSIAKFRELKSRLDRGEPTP